MQKRYRSGRILGLAMLAAGMLGSQGCQKPGQRGSASSLRRLQNPATSFVYDAYGEAYRSASDARPTPEATRLPGTGFTQHWSDAVALDGLQELGSLQGLAVDQDHTGTGSPPPPTTAPTNSPPSNFGLNPEDGP
jgi:hypothetical protein